MIKVRLKLCTLFSGLCGEWIDFYSFIGAIYAKAYRTLLNGLTYPSLKVTHISLTHWENRLANSHSDWLQYTPIPLKITDSRSFNLTRSFVLRQLHYYSSMTPIQTILGQKNKPRWSQIALYGCILFSSCACALVHSIQFSYDTGCVWKTRRCQVT